MHDALPYGRLEVEGKPIPDEALSRRAGCESIEQFRGLLAELFAAGVPGRGDDGIVYSRRMIRDQQERDGSRDRQRRHRGHADVTPTSRVEVRGQRLEVRGKSKVKTRTQNPRAPSTPEAQRRNIENRNRRLEKEKTAKAQAQIGSGPLERSPSICESCGHTKSWHLREAKKSSLDHDFKVLERSQVN
jgi:hypothetical protein